MCVFRYKDQFKIVTIMVGSISHEQEQKYGILLSSYLANPENLFVISSDFCHWGTCHVTLHIVVSVMCNIHHCVNSSVRHLLLVTMDSYPARLPQLVLLLVLLLLLLLMLPQAPEDDRQERVSCTRKVDDFVYCMAKAAMLSFHQGRRTS